jgi:hypothetical protein
MCNGLAKPATDAEPSDKGEMPHIASIQNQNGWSHNLAQNTLNRAQLRSDYIGEDENRL